MSFAARFQRRYNIIKTLGSCFDSGAKRLFLALDQTGDNRLPLDQFGVSFAVSLDNRGHQPAQERLFQTQGAPVQKRAADEAAQHIIAPLVPGVTPSADRKIAARTWSAMIRAGRDLGIIWIQIRHAQIVSRLLAIAQRENRVDERRENVVLVNRVHALQNRGDAIQAHAGINARRRERQKFAVFLLVILLKHQIPDFAVTVAIAAGPIHFGIAGIILGAPVIKNLRVRPARPAFADRPPPVVFFAEPKDAVVA